MGLTITVLGCSGSYPGPGVAASSYLVRSDRTTVWLDAGPGSLVNLQLHVGLDALDAVVLTHAHVDHWLDVRPLHTALSYFLGIEGLPVYGTAETLGLVSHLTAGHLDPSFAWATITAEERLRIGDLDLRFARTDHPVETLATRVDGPGDRSLAYSADTGPAWSMATLGMGINLALVEATLHADDEGSFQHLSGREAGALATSAGVERLLLTHLPPGADADERRRQAASMFDGPVELATVNERYEV